MKLHRQESHPDNPTVLPRPLTPLENPLSPTGARPSLPSLPTLPEALAPPCLAPPPPSPPPLPPLSLRAGADLLPRVSTLLLEPEGATLSRSAAALPAVSGVGTLSRTGLSLPLAVCTQPGPGVPPFGPCLRRTGSPSFPEHLRG